ncbi:MAG: hypothetical protein M5R42_21355, partial [Rhodocyclaceae bacterium]|nr:hypothetical protein [Rhodocyclaceae bacterium]
MQPILSDHDIALLLSTSESLRHAAAKPDPRPNMLVRLLLDTGIKKSECMRLQPSDILRQDASQPMLMVRHRKPNNVYKERKILLDRDW